LYARAVPDIQAHLGPLWRRNFCLIKVTDVVIEEVRQWQARPWELYPIVWLDALIVKVREHNRVMNKAVYRSQWQPLSNKELLGLWIAQSEEAKFWLAFSPNQEPGPPGHLDCLRGWTHWISRGHRSIYPHTGAVVHCPSGPQFPQVCPLEATARWRLTSRASTKPVRLSRQKCANRPEVGCLTCTTISALWLRHWEDYSFLLLSGAGWSTPPMLLSRSTAPSQRCSRPRAHFR